jgi:hypothetical protein
MVAHARAFQPRLCGTLSETELYTAVDRLVAGAGQVGFDRRGQARLFVELGILHGSGFTDDPQLPWVREVMDDPGFPFPQQRAEALHERADAYSDAVYGPEGEYVRAARRRVGDQSHWPTPAAAELEDVMLATLLDLHPEKVAYLGEKPIRELISEARGVAKRWRMPGPRPIALMAVLMNLFGHRCDDDPLYPWINRTLVDSAIRDGETRAQRLERRALAWMRVVLERDAEEGGA